MKFLTVLSFILFGFGSQVMADEPCTDLNGDGQVNFTDFLIFTESYNKPTDCAQNKPVEYAGNNAAVVLVKLGGIFYTDYNYDSNYRSTIFVNFNLSRLKHMIDAGYIIADFYITFGYFEEDKQEGRIEHFRPNRFLILYDGQGSLLSGRQPGMPSEQMRFGISGSGLYFLGAGIGADYAKVANTLNFLMINKQNIVTDNTTN